MIHSACRWAARPGGREKTMNHRNGFTLIEVMIVVAIIAILAMIAVNRYQAYLERAHDSAVQSLLQNLALAEMTLKSDPNRNAMLPVEGATAGDSIRELGAFGFRPDPRVGFVALPSDPSNPDGFLLFAAYGAVDARVYVYDFIPRAGVWVFDPAADYAPLLPGTLIAYAWQPSGPAKATVKLSVDGNGRVWAVTTP